MENQEEQKPLGILFNTLNYYTVDDLNKFIDNLTVEQSIFCLMWCCEYAQGKGILSLEEAEIISKSIRKIRNSEE